MTTAKERQAIRHCRIAAIRALREYDHAFLSEEGVRELTAPFGFEGSTYEGYPDAAGTPKGLALDGPGPIRGSGAHEVAVEICVHLGLDYPNWIQGRGSLLRVCCDAILKHLDATSSPFHPLKHSITD